MARYYHSYPPKGRKHDFGRLLNDNDKAQLVYNRDMAFRKFVKERSKVEPTISTLSLNDYYQMYKGRGVQLSLF